MKYTSEITKLGPLVDEFLRDGNFLIIYNDRAPEELREMAMIHADNKILEPVKVGDKIRLGNQSYTVTAIGDEANNTLASLGHCTFCFNAKKEVELPGQIELSPADVKPILTAGDLFEIEYM